MSTLYEKIRRNPERLSIDERDRKEAVSVAMSTGRYVTRNDKVIVNKRFVEGYMKLIEEN